MSFRKKYFDSFTVLIIVFGVATLIAMILNSQYQSAEEKRQAFENALLEKVVHADSVVIHNQGVIIHNQKQFSTYGMKDNGNVSTPNIRTDWINITAH